jgi:Tfp pilus assembly protein PilX
MIGNQNETLKELAQQKEKEWRLIQEKRIISLETSLNQKITELKEEKSKFILLKEDFKYNLKLMESRDEELAKYEETLLASRRQLSDKNSEISELKIKIDELMKRAQDETDLIDENKKYFMKRLNQKQQELDQYKASKDCAINEERSQIEKYKRTLQTQLQDLQYDLEKQRTEMKTEFDEILRRREHEWRIKDDEWNTQLLSKDLEIKMLKNELNHEREMNTNLNANTSDAESAIKERERKIKEKEWELNDTIAIKDAQIKEIEKRLAQFKADSKIVNDELNRKCEELDRKNHEKNQKIENLKEAIKQADTSNESLKQTLKTDETKAKNYTSQLEKQINDLKIEKSKQTYY